MKLKIGDIIEYTKTYKHLDCKCNRGIVIGTHYTSRGLLYKTIFPKKFLNTVCYARNEIYVSPREVRKVKL